MQVVILKTRKDSCNWQTLIMISNEHTMLYIKDNIGEYIQILKRNTGVVMYASKFDLMWNTKMLVA